MQKRRCWRTISATRLSLGEVDKKKTNWRKTNQTTGKPHTFSFGNTNNKKSRKKRATSRRKKNSETNTQTDPDLQSIMAECCHPIPGIDDVFRICRWNDQLLSWNANVRLQPSWKAVGNHILATRMGYPHKTLLPRLYIYKGNRRYETLNGSNPNYLQQLNVNIANWQSKPTISIFRRRKDTIVGTWCGRH